MPLTDAQVLAVTLVLCVFNVVYKPVSIASLQKTVRREGVNERGALYDAWHDALPDLSRVHWLGDVMGVVFVVVGVPFLALTGNASVLLRIVAVTAAAATLKLFVNNLTLLPDPSGECAKRERGAWRHLFGTCNELMPSGHLVPSFAALVLTYGRIPASAWLVLLTFVTAQSVVTIASRNHYSLDVVASLLVALAMAPPLR